MTKTQGQHHRGELCINLSHRLFSNPTHVGIAVFHFHQEYTAKDQQRILAIAKVLLPQWSRLADMSVGTTKTASNRWKVTDFIIVLYTVAHLPFLELQTKKNRDNTNQVGNIGEMESRFMHHRAMPRCVDISMGTTYVKESGKTPTLARNLVIFPIGCLGQTRRLLCRH